MRGCLPFHVNNCALIYVLTKLLVIQPRDKVRPMKPNFALSLSFDGIKLLHRAAGGWREVGEVAVTADDLGAELAMLRKTAASLEPGGVRTKLIIPASQIKYLTIETAGLSDAARRKEAEAALESATPYEVSDLSYDISMDGQQTHVAAVAKETLAEAEAFATEHRFHPVSFVAVPDDAPYLGEPFFGPTVESAKLLDAGEQVEPDGIAVVIVGAIAQPVVEDLVAEPTPPISDAREAEVEAKPEVETETPAPAKADAPVEAVAETPPAPAEAETAEDEGQPELDLTPTASKSAKLEESIKADEPAVEPTAKTQKPEAAPAVEAPQTPKASAAPAADTPAPADKAPQPDTAKAALSAAAAATGASVDKAARVAPLPPADPPKVAAPTGFSSRRKDAGAAGASKPVGGARRIAVAPLSPDSSSLSKPAPAPMVADEAPAEESTAFAPGLVAASRRIKSEFMSRRKPRTGAAAPIAAPAVAVPSTGSEAERMTVFGARSQNVGGKPRFLGLIMTVILLVFLAGVAAWAAVFLDEGIAGLLKDDKGRVTASAPENQIDPEVIRTPDGIDPEQTSTEEDVQVAALDPVLSAEDTAVLDALQDTRLEPQVPVITEAEAAARYAVTGIWPLAPETPLAAPDTPAEPVFRTGIDPVSTAADALALPAPQQFDTDVQLAAVVSPPPFGQTTQRDANGLIVPSAEGVVTPDGYTLIAASPPLKPPQDLTRFATPQTETAPVVSALAAFRPQNRPLGLAEKTERAQLGGVTRSELAVYRPSLRPSSIQDRARKQQEDAQAAEQEEEANAAAAAAAAQLAAAASAAVPQPAVAAVAPAIQNATRLATQKSIRPDVRPRDFNRIVKRAQRAAPREETRVAAARTVAPRTVTPKVPSKASVSRSATVKNAINLRRVNLIGVYGKPSSRRALVRLANGRYQKVKVGDRIDGGRVAAISNSELRYKKGSRNVVLKMP